ncbi:MAG: TIGR04283 family arsenosugar biosynthesis glycosyltransferase [Methylomonas sp.]|nr:TIGR04283 family arsenosugar biosynthesis glycosyltransferase [Methylomonas sp.]
MKPKISIVIPVLNEAGNLPIVLQGLQSFRADCELIVVDGGSTDASAKLAEPLADKVLAAARGRAKQMSLGATHAQAEILLFLHADTFLPDAAVSRILQAVERGYCWGRFDVSFDNPTFLFELIAWMMNNRSRLTGIATGDQALFVTRSAFEAIGGFPDIALMEDIAISARLKKLAPPCCLTEKVTTSARRWQRHGALKTILSMWRLRLAYFFGADPDDLAARYYRS